MAYPRPGAYTGPPEAGMSDLPHYLGHRKRLKERLAKAGRSALADHETLELLLTLVIPRKDVKPIAKAVLNAYGGLRPFLDAPFYEWENMPGLGPATASNLLVVREVIHQYLQEGARCTDGQPGWEGLLDYWKSRIGPNRNEIFEAAFLDAGLRVIPNGIVRMEEGVSDRASVYPRKIVAKALGIGAVFIVLAHNHTNGKAEPSEEDKLITRAIVLACQTVQIRVCDHYIVTTDGFFSFKKAGLL